MSETKHTPLPWKQSQMDPRHVDTLGGRMCIDCSQSGASRYVDAANAAFIARACNVHDDLLAALKDAQQELCVVGCVRMNGDVLLHHDTCSASVAAIAKAEQP